MKMKCVLLIVSVMAGLSAWGEDVQPDKAKALGPEERAQYAKLCQAEFELSSQLRVLTDLAEEHAKRSTDQPNASTTDKAKWETELVNELRDKGTAVLGQLNEATKRRAAFEAAHAPMAAVAVLTGGALEEGRNYNADEFIFVYKLDERLTRVRQELVATADAAKGLYSQLQTNTTTEAVARVSDLLEENGRLKRLWEREQSELELKKLEFRALRKP